MYTAISLRLGEHLERFGGQTIRVWFGNYEARNYEWQRLRVDKVATMRPNWVSLEREGEKHFWKAEFNST